MTGPRTILAASDLSKGAGHALARAVRLAGEHDARLIVLHVTPPLLAADPTKDLERLEAIRAELAAQVDALVAKQRKRQPAEQEVRVVPGRDFLGIITEARAAQADLVVVGAHGADALRDLVMGTTAERVLRQGDRALLIVKRPPAGPYRRVLVAVDFSETSSRALALARAVAPHAALSVVHACDVEMEVTLRRAGAPEGELAAYRKRCLEAGAAEMERFLASAGGAGAQVARVLEGGRATDVIPEVARRRRADLIVMGTHGRTGLSHLLLGSVAEHVLRDARCDVLAARPEAFRFEMP